MRSTHPPHIQARRSTAGRMFAAAGSFLAAAGVAAIIVATVPSTEAAGTSKIPPTHQQHPSARTPQGATVPSPHRPPLLAGGNASEVLPFRAKDRTRLKTGRPSRDHNSSSVRARGAPAAWASWAGKATSAECPGLSPLVLLAIGKNETRYGTIDMPGVTSGQNGEGAEGPMQFMRRTFAAFAVSVGGRAPDPYRPVDALFAAAKYLCALHGATSWQGAVFQYCGGDSGRPGAGAQCWAYVSEVGSEIESYRS